MWGNPVHNSPQQDQAQPTVVGYRSLGGRPVWGRFAASSWTFLDGQSLVAEAVDRQCAFAGAEDVARDRWPRNGRSRVSACPAGRLFLSAVPYAVVVPDGRVPCPAVAFPAPFVRGPSSSTTWLRL
jgi:hypothetical protein